MASQVFKFPGFFDREIDLTQQVQEPVGVPAGVIGAAEKGPAFIPITVGSFADFRIKFGDLNPRLVAPYAVDKFLENKTALTFVRVLGAGANVSSTDIENTRTKGTVKNAGFIISGTLVPDVGKHVGSVQFLVARHVVTGSEAFGFPVFTDNDSYFTSGSADEVYLTRGVLFVASGTRVQILDYNESWTAAADDIATSNPDDSTFKLVLSSAVGTTFGNDDGFSGVRILTASLDPGSSNYFAKVLNRDPEKFGDELHLVYCDLAVDAELAAVGTGSGDVAILSGSSNTSSTSGDTSLPFTNAFGKYDTRFATPRTPWFISQPYGDVEHDLFYFEAIDDGAYANTRIKISISNLLKSTNPRDKHATFSIQVRTFDDTDAEPKLLEQFNNVNLNPNSDSFIGKVIGDKKARFNFDVTDTADRRLITTGKFPNRSKNIRVVLSQEVLNKKLPQDAAPFGFRGLEVLNTNSRLLDVTGASDFSSVARLAGEGVTDPRLLGSIVPPMPYVFKITRGDVDTSGGGLTGAPGPTEIVDGRFYWGVKFSRNSNTTNPNIVNEQNKLISSLVKFSGIEKLDTLVTGSQKDAFNNNKFTLARVALGNTAVSQVTGSAVQHMKEAAYIRNGRPDPFEYKITDGSTDRITLATLYQKGTTAADFNKFSNFAKYTTVLLGGFDGVNILDKNAATLNDRASSTETRTSDGEIGNAASTFTSPGFAINQNGVGIDNSTVNSYRVASDIITDAIASNINILVVPGQRDSLVTNYVADKVRDFGLAFYAMDVPNYDSADDRIWDGDSNLFPDVEKTANNFEARALDNEFVGAYFPNVVIDDRVNRRRVSVPSSIASMAALGFNDKVAFPWFAPAGFNRAALDFVVRSEVKINQPERERLVDVNINPVVRFPDSGFVIFSQETLEQAGTALGSINVVRMLNELKRKIIEVASRVIFEQIDQQLRNTVSNSFRNVLNTVVARAGIERFEVVADERNNTKADEEANRVNVRIILVPTRAIEFIAIDFIITRSGVQFV